jgi:hypothetical protein
MRFALGDIAVGSFHGTQISLQGPGASSICMIAFGRAALSMRVSPSSRRTKKVVSKPVAASNLPWLQRRAAPPESNMNFCQGAWTDLAAWDVHRAKVFGRCEKKSGIAPVDRLIAEVTSQDPYKSARRVLDHG